MLNIDAKRVCVNGST